MPEAEKKKKTPSLTAVVRPEVRAYVMDRARLITFGRQGEAMRRIVDYWIAMGAPPLTPGDLDYPAPPEDVLKLARDRWAHTGSSADFKRYEERVLKRTNPDHGRRLQAARERRSAERKTDN